MIYFLRSIQDARPEARPPESRHHPDDRKPRLPHTPRRRPPMLGICRRRTPPPTPRIARRTPSRSRRTPPPTPRLVRRTPQPDAGAARHSAPATWAARPCRPDAGGLHATRYAASPCRPDAGAAHRCLSSCSYTTNTSLSIPTVSRPPPLFSSIVVTTSSPHRRYRTCWRSDRIRAVSRRHAASGKPTRWRRTVQDYTIFSAQIRLVCPS